MYYTALIIHKKNILFFITDDNSDGIKIISESYDFCDLDFTYTLPKRSLAKLVASRVLENGQTIKVCFLRTGAVMTKQMLWV